MNHPSSIDNVARNAVLLTGTAHLGMVIIALSYRNWWLAGATVAVFILWAIATLRLTHLSDRWSNRDFVLLSIILMLAAQDGIALLWLALILLLALAGWDLMHLHLRATNVTYAPVRENLSQLVAQHYRILALSTSIGIVLLILVNSINVTLELGWVLLALLLGGISLGSIVRWVNKHYK